MTKYQRLTAHEIALALNMQKNRQGYVGTCPCCWYKGAFTVTEKSGRVLFYCHAGGCSFQEIITSPEFSKLWKPYATPAKAATIKPSYENLAIENATNNKAAEIWQSSLFAEGTVVEKYLRSRGITLNIPTSIRFHPECWHPPSGQSYPAMVAKVTPWQAKPLVAIHRTYLKPDGSNKIHPQPKMMLGNTDRGSVHLADPEGNTLGVCEGIETGLTVYQVTGMPIWVGLSTGGLQRMEIPGSICKIVIFADNDAGLKNPGIEAAEKAARRWWLEGKSVEIRKPSVGRDFNDLLIEGGFYG